MLARTGTLQQLAQREQGLLQRLFIQRMADGEADCLGGREVAEKGRSVIPSIASCK